MHNVGTVSLRFYRTLIVVVFALNGVAIWFSSPLISLFATIATIGFLTFCIRCSVCGKSPYIWRRGSLRIGSAIPERACSRCGHVLYGRDLTFVGADRD